MGLENIQKIWLDGFIENIVYMRYGVISFECFLTWILNFFYVSKAQKIKKAFLSPDD